MAARHDRTAWSPNQWWRATKYELRDGYIRPAKGAAIKRTEPWRAWVEKVGARNAGEQPHRQLLTLLRDAEKLPGPNLDHRHLTAIDLVATKKIQRQLRELNPDKQAARKAYLDALHAERERLRQFDLRAEKNERERPIDAAAAQRVLAWCNEYGLLGLLLHNVEVTWFAPRWVTATSRQAERHARDDGPTVYPAQRSVSWEAGKFIERRELLHIPAHSGIKAGQLVVGSGMDIPFPKVGARDRYHQPESTGPYEEPERPDFDRDRTPQAVSIAESWGRFFPDVRTGEKETFDYPSPMNEGFWRSYAEPVTDFARAIRSVRDALLDVEKARRATRDDERRRYTRSFDRLLAPVSQVLDVESRGVVLDWSSPSLLGSLAVLAGRELARSAGVYTCRECESVFVASREAYYCSDRCSKAVEMRRYRKRKKREQRARGEP